MKHALFLAVCSVALRAADVPETPAEQRGKKLIAEAVQALGGDNFLNMEDRIESGRAYSFYREKISGLSVAKIYTRYLTVAKGKSGEDLGQRERQAFGKNEDSAALFTETGGWEISWRGAKDLPKDQVERHNDTTMRNIFYILRQRLNEPGMIFEARGADVVEMQPVDVVDVTDSENRLVTVYLHQSTKLPVRQMYSRMNPETKQRDDEVTLFSRYRDAGGGVQWPHQIRRERNGEKVYEIYSDSVVINKNLTDDLFSVPAAGAKPEKTRKK